MTAVAQPLRMLTTAVAEAALGLGASACGRDRDRRGPADIAGLRLVFDGLGPT